jgi:hypothetical protein
MTNLNFFELVFARSIFESDEFNAGKTTDGKEDPGNNFNVVVDMMRIRR